MNYLLILFFSLGVFQVPQWQDPGDLKGIFFDPHNDQIAYALTSRGGIYKTEEAGDSWIQLKAFANRAQQIFSVNEQFKAMCINPADPAEIFLAGQQSIYKSADRGNTWERIVEFSKISDDDGLNSLAINPKNLSDIYVGVFMHYGFVKSMNGGTTWQTGIASLPDQLQIHKIEFNPDEAETVLAVGYRSFGSLKQKSYYQLLESEDNGKLFKPLGPKYDRIDAMALLPKKDDEILISADTDIGTNTSNGIFKSYFKGRLWNKITDGWFTSIAICPAQPGIVYASGERLIKSSDSGNTFSELILPANSFFRYCAVSPLNSDFVYIGSEEKTIYRSTDGGQNWQKVLDLNAP